MTTAPSVWLARPSVGKLAYGALFMLVLPAGLGVALGSGVQGLHRWPSRG